MELWLESCYNETGNVSPHVSKCMWKTTVPHLLFIDETPNVSSTKIPTVLMVELLEIWNRIGKRDRRTEIQKNLWNFHFLFK